MSSGGEVAAVAGKSEPVAAPSFREALRLWLKVGLISFGGPAGQIAILHEELVDRRRWVAEREFLTALNFCMLLPGPEAQQLATFLGRKLHGLRGALAAGVLFVLPGAVVLFALAWLAAAQGSWPPLQAAFKGMLPVVVALVTLAVWRIGRRTLKTPVAWVLAVAAFVAIGVIGIGFPWVIAAALAIGLIADRFGVTVASLAHAIVETDRVAPVNLARATWRVAGLTAIFAVLWAAPVALVLALAGLKPFADVAVFFTQAAFVTFGIAAALTTWVTFLPCFYFVLVGAPVVEGLAADRRAHAALSGVTAAVVGVIATLALTIAREAFLPDGRFDLIAATFAVIAFIAALRFKVGALWLVAAGAAVGVARALMAPSP